jgi:L-ascorbate 6-phosphate lactonase
MDSSALKRLTFEEKTKLVIPRAHEALASSWGFGTKQVIGMNHKKIINTDGVEIKAIAVKHDEFMYNDSGDHFFLDYIIKYGGLTIYHAGDTVGFPELPIWLKKEKIDIALIPINGRDFMRTSLGIVGNCNYREAADLAMAAGVDLVIPMHFGLFQ